MPEWLTFLLADTSALQLVFWIIAISALIGTIVKLWPSLTAFVRIVNATAGLPDFIERTDATLLAQDEKIAEIHHEVNYNNGGSVKDAVSRVETGVAGLYVKVQELADADASLAAADAVLRKELEDTRPGVPPRNPKEKP